MDCSTAKCYSSDWNSYLSPEGHIPHALSTELTPHPSTDLSWYTLIIWHTYKHGTLDSSHAHAILHFLNEVPYITGRGAELFEMPWFIVVKLNANIDIYSVK